MTNSDKAIKKDEVSLVDFFRPLVGWGSQIWRGTLVVVLIGLIAGMAYWLMQPVRRTTSLEFRPLFEGADEGMYPNGLRFSPTDITSPSITEQVHTKNDLGTYCQAGRFSSGFTVQQSSPALHFLNLEYEGRLADTRVTAVERQRLQEEYESRRAALKPQYKLVFIHPLACKSLPSLAASKALTEVLETWAADSQQKRGVMRLQISVLAPSIFDRVSAMTDNLLVRADLLRTMVGRVVANISEVEELPGADVVRAGQQQVSLAQARIELEDLIQTQLDPLVAEAGASLGARAGRWIDHAVKSAEIRLQQAQEQADAYRMALREYSGLPGVGPTPPPGERTPSTGDVQTLTPQIDRTFIDRIVELSTVNTTFRQEITRKTIEASVVAVNRGAVVNQYKQLLAAMRAGGPSLSPESLQTRLDRATREAKDATHLFNQIYDEFGRISLRSGSALYRVEQPPFTTELRAFSLWDMALLLMTLVFLVPVLLAIAVLIRFHTQRFVASLR